MAVSAWEPQRLEEQSRGVPSATGGVSQVIVLVRARGRGRTGEPGHVNTIGAPDHGDDAVGRGMVGGQKSGEKKGVSGVHVGRWVERLQPVQDGQSRRNSKKMPPGLC